MALHNESHAASILFDVDGLYNIGASAASRPANIYAQTAIFAAGSAVLTAANFGANAFPLLAPNGSATAPSYSFSTGGADSGKLGMYRPASGQLGISAYDSNGGVGAPAAMFSSNFGVGRMYPANPNGTFTSFYGADSSNGRLQINASGPVIYLYVNGLYHSQFYNDGTTAALLINKALVTDPTDIALTADNQAIELGQTSYVRLTSNDATAANRTFTLNIASAEAGQFLVLEWNDATNAGELLNAGNAKLSADWRPTARYQNLSLRFDGAFWIETSRSPSGGSTSFPLFASDGTSAAPSYSFTNQTGMGMYRDSAGVLGLSWGHASNKVLVGTEANGGPAVGSNASTFYIMSGSPTQNAATMTPSRMGFYQTGDAYLLGGATFNGVLHMGMNIIMTYGGGSGYIQAGNGTSTVPSYSFASDSSVGMYKDASGQGVAFAQTGFEYGSFYVDGGGASRLEFHNGITGATRGFLSVSRGGGVTLQTTQTQSIVFNCANGANGNTFYLFDGGTGQVAGNFCAAIHYSSLTLNPGAAVNGTAASTTITSHGSASVIYLSSDNATPANRTFVLSNGSSLLNEGQIIILVWNSSTSGGQIVQDANTSLAGGVTWSVDGSVSNYSNIVFTVTRPGGVFHFTEISRSIVGTGGAGDNSLGDFKYLASNTSVYGGTNSVLSFTGAQSVVIGVGSGNNSATDAGGNVFIGYQVAPNMASPVGSSTAVGWKALNALTTGGENDAFGAEALWNVTTGSFNCSFGEASSRTITTGSRNNAFGNGALVQAGTNSSNNTCMGTSSLNSLLTGNGNTAFGNYSGYNETGSNAFYVNNIQQSSLANDQAFSLMYGQFSGTAGSLTNQQLTVNGTLNVNTSTTSRIRLQGTGGRIIFDNSTDYGFGRSGSTFNMWFNQSENGGSLIFGLTSITQSTSSATTWTLGSSGFATKSTHLLKADDSGGATQLGQNLIVRAGNSTNVLNDIGGSLALNAGNQTLASATAAGGPISISAGNASGASSTGDGGKVTISTGSSVGGTAGIIDFQIGGSSKVKIDSTGTPVPTTSATTNFGDPSFKWRNGYFSGYLRVGDSLGGGLDFNGNGAIYEYQGQIYFSDSNESISTVSIAHVANQNALTVYTNGAFGNIVWNSDGGGNIGASAASRPDIVNIKSKIVLGEIATPANPAASNHALYFKSDGNLYMKNNAGTESQISGASPSFPILAPAGTAAAPSYSFSAVPDMGMYDSGPELGFAYGGVLRMFLTSTTLNMRADISLQNSHTLSFLGSSSGAITIQPNAVAGTYTLTLPNAQGAAGTFLTNDGSGNLSWSGFPLRAPNGTTTAPSYSFANGTNDGMWWGGAGEIDFSTSGVTRMYITTTDMEMRVNLHMQSGKIIKADDGSSSAPAYTFGSNTSIGMTNRGSNTLGFDVPTGGVFSFQKNGVDKLVWSTTFLNLYDMDLRVATSGFGVRNQDGTEAAPSYHWDSETTSGMWRNGANTVSFSTSSTESLRLTSNGDVVIMRANSSSQKLYLGPTANNISMYGDSNSMHMVTQGGGFLINVSGTDRVFLSTSQFNLYSTHLVIQDIGFGLRVKEGTNAKQGVSTLVAGTVTVANTSVTATSRIFLTVQSLGTVAVPQAVAVTGRNVGTDFTITSQSLTDTSVVAWEIFEIV